MIQLTYGSGVPSSLVLVSFTLFRGIFIPPQTANARMKP